MASKHREGQRLVARRYSGAAHHVRLGNSSRPRPRKLCTTALRLHYLQRPSPIPVRSPILWIPYLADIPGPGIFGPRMYMKILIAEDYLHLGRLFGGLVRRWGYDVILVSDGNTALDILRDSNPPPLALLDWQMPGLDGIEVCRRVRWEAEGAYPYLVLMTGAGNRDEMLVGLQAGADDFLLKPVDEAELQARLAVGRRIVLLQQRLRDVAARDALTGLWNRGAVLDMLSTELSRGGREGCPTAVLLADVDHFKHFNDNYGHLGGDEALREASIRPYDMAARYGGEEFIAVLPGCGEVDAMALAERVRLRVSAFPVWCGDVPVSLTISIGVAAWTEPGLVHMEALLQAADKALYRAKRSGRNRVMLGEASAGLAGKHLSVGVTGESD